MDSSLFKLIFLIVAVIVSLVWNAYQKRRQEEEDAKPWLPPQPKSGTPAPRPSSQPRPAEPQSWEEQLRRLLEGEAPAPPRPPVVVYRETSPAPPPIPRATPVPAPRVEEINPMDIGLPVAMPSLTQSAAAHHRATHLDEAVAERFRKAGKQVTSHTPMREQRASASEIRYALGLLHDRHSQRAAIVASVVLGPPKALEN